MYQTWMCTLAGKFMSCRTFSKKIKSREMYRNASRKYVPNMDVYARKYRETTDLDMSAELNSVILKLWPNL